MNDLYERVMYHLKEVYDNINDFHEITLILRKNFTELFRKSEGHLKPFMRLHDSGIFVDVGGYIGTWTIPLAKEGVEVHSFEPSPKARAILTKRCMPFPNVHIHPIALGDNNGIGWLNIHLTSSSNGLRLKQRSFTNRRILVEVRTIDSFNFEHVSLIKIDTEGFELQVLLGAKKTIEKYKPRLVIEVHPPFDEESEKISSFLKDIGYKWFMFNYVPRRSYPHIIAESR